MIHTAYTWERPKIAHPMLVPMVRVWHNKPGKDPREAAREASDRAGGPRPRWALADQPPGPSGGHTYGTEFSWPYERLGTARGSWALREWMAEAFYELKALGWHTPPEFMPLDWEGHYDPIRFVGGKTAIQGRIDRMAEIRAHTLRFAIVDCAAQVWGDEIEASNYEDRPGIEGDTDVNGWQYPATGVSRIASPVTYPQLKRGRTIGDAALEAASTLGKANAAGVPCVPWVIDPRFAGDGMDLLDEPRGKLIYDTIEAYGVERVILFGERQGWAQVWLCENYGG